MEEKFKRFLEQEFLVIPPTKAAMELRIKKLNEMKEREIDLRRKGITDDALLYQMITEEQSNLKNELLGFDEKAYTKAKSKRIAMYIGLAALIGLLILVATYLIVSFAIGNIWDRSWLILVDGILYGGAIAAFAASIVFVAKGKLLPFRLGLSLAIILASVATFLIVQLVVYYTHSWFIFLVMVLAIQAVNMLISLFSRKKYSLIEIPIFIELLGVFLYVILGITKLLAWHPGWLLCLAGVFALILELVIMVSYKIFKSNKESEQALKDKFEVRDDDYYTKW